MTKKAQFAFQKKAIVPKSKNFSAWYNGVVLRAELADYAPVKGLMVIRPYGYGLWENIKRAFDKKIKAEGVENAYFPLFIPEHFLKKEKEHVEGFSPELAVVTIGGGEELKEKLVVRPTSETVMYAMYAKWIKSHRDLPLLINQWNNVVRWEKRTYLFLRTTEFLWQEGHTVHVSQKEAVDFALKALSWYRRLYQDFFAMPGIVGLKSEAEKFAGAKTTWTIEFLMPDGKALQGATSHHLGQNFSRVFDITFQDEEGKNQYAWQTSWGLSTRSIGGLVMMHGDDHGLVLPPKLAPIQVVIIPIPKGNRARKISNFKFQISNYVERIKKILAHVNIRVKVDDREEHTVGWKFNEWELKGIPLRLEIGEREVVENIVTAVRRDTNVKCQMSNVKCQTKLKNLLAEIQANLFARAKKFLKDNTHEVTSYGEFKEIMRTNRGFLKAFWCGNPVCEKKIKQETKATTRLLPLNAKKEKGECIYCQKRASYRWYFAQAY